jgi:hypothetical protein
MGFGVVEYTHSSAMFTSIYFDYDIMTQFDLSAFYIPRHSYLKIIQPAQINRELF